MHRRGPLEPVKNMRTAPLVSYDTKGVPFYSWRFFTAKLAVSTEASVKRIRNIQLSKGILNEVSGDVKGKNIKNLNPFIRTVR